MLSAPAEVQRSTLTGRSPTNQWRFSRRMRARKPMARSSPLPRCSRVSLVSPQTTFSGDRNASEAPLRRRQRAAVQAAMITLGVLPRHGRRGLAQPGLPVGSAGAGIGVIRPYMTKQVGPYVLTAEAEQALKPKDAFRDCTDNCPDMVAVQAGGFMMGRPRANEPGLQPRPEQPAASRPDRPCPSRCRNTRSPSTTGMPVVGWRAAATAICPRDGGWGRGKRPVIFVSWDDAKAVHVDWLLTQEELGIKLSPPDRSGMGICRPRRHSPRPTPPAPPSPRR